MSTRSTLSPLFSWRAAVCDSDLPATVRHVLLTLSLYMSERGDSAFPGNARLAHDTALERKAIMRALATAVDKGWLTIKVKGCSLKGGRRLATEYAASTPTGTSGGPVPERDRSLSGTGLVPLRDTTGTSEGPHVVSKASEKAPSLSDEVVHRAIALVADRRVERAKTLKRHIVNMPAYRRKVLSDATEELTDELAKRAAGNPAWTAEDLAGMFEKPFSPYDVPPDVFR